MNTVSGVVNKLVGKLEKYIAESQKTAKHCKEILKTDRAACDERDWYMCINKKDMNGSVVEMSEYDKYVIIKNGFPNHRVLAIDGFSGNEGSWKPGTTFIIISKDTLIKDIDNTIIGTNIRVMKDDGSCECCSSEYSRKFQMYKAHSYSE